ncbi:hypothetical protein K4L44_10500 [Halosquirtibacter laminarini]|uniref:Uncharacterized protein n=1 Tax=Halosquirtibacter laminarini TaxID=3374600 RepID=A0AC61NBY5_9BACT|nr:hypothetical protein K4L44_10500 [Prolixibacteraceae bacterium]
MTSSSNNQKANYMGPFLIMVALFFIVGFLTVVNQQFQAPLKAAFLSNAGALKNTLTTFITFAFFMGYPAMGSISSKWVDKNGYKSTLVRGLVMLVIALGIFEVSAFSNAHLGSMSIGAGETLPYAFIIFFLGSFFLGCALAVLQVVINPYLVNCDVKGTSSVTRINIGGASNSIGTTLAPFFVSGIVFAGTANPTVDQLYVPFAVLMATVALVAMTVTKLHLPNISSNGAEEVVVDDSKSVWSFKQLKYGVIGIFVYVGAEVCIGANINLFAEARDYTAEIASTMAAMYWGGMLIGRLCGSFLAKVSGQRQLIVASLIATTLIVLSMLMNNPWLLVGVGLVHSIMWGAIFALAIDKLGAYTSKGSGALMIGVAGGAVLPWFQGIAADVLGGWEMTWVIVILCELYILWYAISGHKPSNA